MEKEGRLLQRRKRNIPKVVSAAARDLVLTRPPGQFVSLEAGVIKVAIFGEKKTKARRLLYSLLLNGPLHDLDLPTVV